jgi:hypothetical protein
MPVDGISVRDDSRVGGLIMQRGDKSAPAYRSFDVYERTQRRLVHLMQHIA